jgi:phosphoglucosamine mutase
VPQVLVNVNVANKRPVEELPEFQKQAARGGERSWATERAACWCATAGTEPKARVMVEGDDEARVRGYAAELAAALQRSLAGAA